MFLKSLEQPLTFKGCFGVKFYIHLDPQTSIKLYPVWQFLYHIYFFTRSQMQSLKKKRSQMEASLAKNIVPFMRTVRIVEFGRVY